MNEHNTGVTLKDSSSTLYDILRDDLINPSFMNDIMDFYKIEMLQGQSYKVAPQYINDE